MYLKITFQGDRSGQSHNITSSLLAQVQVLWNIKTHQVPSTLTMYIQVHFRRKDKRWW